MEISASSSNVFGGYYLSLYHIYHISILDTEENDEEDLEGEELKKDLEKHVFNTENKADGAFINNLEGNHARGVVEDVQEKNTEASNDEEESDAHKRSEDEESLMNRQAAEVDDSESHSDAAASLSGEALVNKLSMQDANLEKESHKDAEFIEGLESQDVQAREVEEDVDASEEETLEGSTLMHQLEERDRIANENNAKENKMASQFVPFQF